MNLTLDLKSITDDDSERSSNEFESYEYSTRERGEVKDEGGEEEGEEEEEEEDGRYQSDEDEDEDEDTCEFAAQLEEKLRSCDSSLSRDYDLDSVFNYPQTRSNRRLFDNHSYEDGDWRTFRLDSNSRSRRLRNGDLVCFYVNTVTESNDLIKYIRPSDGNPRKCDCWLSDLGSPKRDCLLSVERGERKTKRFPWEREERCGFRSVSAPSRGLDEETYRRLLIRKLWLWSRWGSGDGVEVPRLDMCGCRMGSGCGGDDRMVAPSDLDGCAESLAKAARSARNLARDLDRLLNNLSSRNTR